MKNMKNLFILLSILVIFSSCRKHNEIEEPLPSGDAAFLTYSIQNQISANIDQNTHQISVIIPFGSKIDSLVATFTASAGSIVKIDSVIQVSGVSINDFSSSKIYKITAENGTTVNWTVSVDYETYIYLSTDFPSGNSNFLMNVDTSGFSSYTVGTSGKGRIWSFLGIESNQVDTIKFSLASQHPSYSHFPGTDFVYIDNNQPFEMFGKISQQQAEFSGVHINYSGMIFDLPMNDNSIQMKFPAELGSTFTDHGSVSKDTLTTIPGIPIPVTVTINVDFDVTSVIDANGLITTPLGTFKCLREYKVQTTTIQALVYGNPLPGYGGSETTRTYNFLNKEEKYPVLSIDVDSIGNILKIKHLK